MEDAVKGSPICRCIFPTNDNDSYADDNDISSSRSKYDANNAESESLVQAHTFALMKVNLDAMKEKMNDLDAMKEKMIDLDAIKGQIVDLDAMKGKVGDRTLRRQFLAEWRHQQELAAILKIRVKTTVNQTMEKNPIDGTLDHDAFTVMMRNEPKSQTWFLALSAYFVQITLVTLIWVGKTMLWDLDLYHQDADGGSSEEDDKLWTDVIGGSDETNMTLYTRTIRVIVPLFLKLFQGIFVTIASFFIIVRSFNIIDLLKDCTALVVLSEIDIAAFYMVDYGYFGTNFRETAGKSKEVPFPDRKESKINA